MTLSSRLCLESSPARCRWDDPWRHGEPDLADVMADPIVHLVMGRDGLSVDHVWPLVRDVQRRIGRSLCPNTARAA